MNQKDKKLQVLFFTNIPAPYRVDFFNELGKLCDLTVAFEGEVSTERNENWKNTYFDSFTPVFMKGKRTGVDKFFCPGVLKLLSKKWDKIIVGMYSTPTAMLAIEYMRIKRIPFILNSDGGFIKEENKLKYLIKKHFISAASAWLSTAKATTDYLVYYGAKRENCYIYPFSSISEKDIENVKKQDIVEKKSLKDEVGFVEDFVVLSVGRFSYEAGYGKGYDTVLKAAEKMSSSIGFYIVGDEPTEEFLNWKKEKNLTNVHFVGFKTKKELAKYYRAADVFVLMTREDVWGLVINEAMMYGLPIITTDKCIAGLELVIDGENGFLVSVGDYTKLSEKIKLFSENKELCEKFSEKSRKQITDYSIEKMALKHIEIMTSLDF